MCCRMNKVLVGCQQCEPVANAELGKQGVYGAELDTRAPASVAQFGGIDVVLPIRNKQRQRSEPFDDVFARPGPRKSLQEFLQDHAGGDYCVAVLQRLPKRKHLGSRKLHIAAKRE